LSDFFHRFLHLKVQASEVFDQQVITHAIKALCAGQLHNYLVLEHPRTLEELYENFCKFTKSELLHFRKLEQPRKVLKENEASRPTKYNRGMESTMSFNNTTK
jgi:methylphosphotriester-DNA--protein-cysteine methyltransferase